MTVQAPDRTADQRLAALRNANRIRVYRAGVKRDVKSGRLDAADLLLDPPTDLEQMRVYDLLMALPKFGQVKTMRLLNTTRVSRSKTVGGMSDRQRGEIARSIVPAAAVPA